MKKKTKLKKKTLHSMIEYEREFFPKSFKEKTAGDKKTNQNNTGFATEFLENVRKKLTDASQKDM